MAKKHKPQQSSSLPQVYQGRKTIYYGPMRSGKSLELINFANRNPFVENWQAFKPVIDTRDMGIIRSRGIDTTIKCTQVNYARQIIGMISKDSKTILLDEINLFDADGLMYLLEYITLELGMDVVAAGLDRDFKKEWFVLPGQETEPDGDRMTMEQLLQEFDYQYGLTAKCAVCECPAQYTQRLVDGKPAKRSEPLVVIGDLEYEPRCAVCHKMGP